MSEPQFSLARLAMASLGSAVIVLAVATALIALVRPGPGWGLTIALVGIAGAIGVMAWVSTSMTKRALGSNDHSGPDARPDGSGK